MSLRNYRTGDDGIDAAIEDLARSTGRSGDLDMITEMLVTTVRLAREKVGRGDLKLVNNALKELRHAFSVFEPYRAVRKATVFGSARIAEGDPAYVAARDFGAAMAAHDWMVMTGAGPGIMAAGLEGAGRDHSFGINIQLPFESEANEFILDDPKLLNFKYFFTRKVTFMSESHGYALLPGGFGTMDEAFELLTLMQTGKTPLTPVVLLDPPGDTYWSHWTEFIQTELVARNLVSPHDLSLVHATDNPDAAAEHVRNFYRTYHSMRYVGHHLVLRLERQVDDAEVATLDAEFGDLLVDGHIQRCDITPAELRDDDEVERPRLRFHFDRRSHARLRQLIDVLNDAAPDTNS
ncbi:MAG: LOG family protein [Acidimicrobiales bacterium]|nr:LOG family protein [Acidimicrobiales bacterium]